MELVAAIPLNPRARHQKASQASQRLPHIGRHIQNLLFAADMYRCIYMQGVECCYKKIICYIEVFTARPVCLEVQNKDDA